MCGLGLNLFAGSLTVTEAGKIHESRLSVESESSSRRYDLPLNGDNIKRGRVVVKSLSLEEQVESFGLQAS